MIKKLSLDVVRSEIDAINTELLKLLKKRSDLVKQVTVIKAEHGLAAHQPKRFENMMKELHIQAESLGVVSELVDAVWSAIHDSSRSQQNEALRSVA